MGSTATLCRGYPLGHTDPSPAFALHRDGWTALHWAARHGHLPSVNALIHAGAPVNIQDNGYYRWALLCGGSARGRIGGGSARASAAVTRRRTPLRCAAVYGHTDATAALLGVGADASIQDISG